MIARIVKKRIKLFLLFAFLTISGIYTILYFLEDNITFFYTPSDSRITLNREFRLGGFVKEGSIKYVSVNKISFIIKDDKKEINVFFQGSVPMLFRENQAVVVRGKMINENSFEAKQLLAKHDERYIPKK